MYSKSYATSFEPGSSLRINPNVAGVSYKNNQPSTIPVKSFSDSSAYEAFNNIGKKQENTVRIEEKELERDHHEEFSSKENKDDKSNEYSLIEAFNDNRSAISSIIGRFAKIKSFFDFDVIILAFLIAVIFFNKETNDKLTPLALLAVMFL